MRQSTASKLASCVSTPFFIILGLAFGTTSNVAYGFENIKYIQDLRGGLQEPSDVAVAANGDVFVLDKDASKVFVFDRAGKPKLDFGNNGSGAGQFEDPESLAVLPNGHTLVADTGNDRIQVFDSSGKFLFQFGSSGKLQGQFDTPTGIAVDQFGIVFVADQDNHRIQVFSEQGIFLRTFQINGAPRDVAIDPQRNLYVLVPNLSTVIRIPANRERAKTLVGQNEALDFIKSASGIVSDMRGDLYITEQSDESIKKLDPQGHILLSFGSDGEDRGQFDEPSGIGVDLQGNIFVADSDNHRIQVFQVIGSKKGPMPVATHSPPIIEFDAFVKAEEGITDLVSAQEQGLYLLSHGKDRILRIGEMTQVLGKSGNKPGQFDAPRALTTANDGNILIADTDNDRVQVINPDGTPVYQFGKSGEKTGQFDEPEGIAISHKDLIYVSDTQNHRVQIFNKDAIFLSAFGHQSEKITRKTPEHGKFDDPTALAVNSLNQVYVLDSNNHRIQQFTEEGQFIRQIGEQGQKPGQFLEPVDIAVDENNYLYVADQGNNRVQVFNPKGNLAFLFGASIGRKMFGIDISFGSSKESQPGKFKKVSAVTTAKGKLYVADYESKNVQVFRFYPTGLIKEERTYVIKSVFPPQEANGDPFNVAKEAALQQALSELSDKTGLSPKDLQNASKVEGVETLSTGAVQVTISVPKKLIQQGHTKPQAQPQKEKSSESEEFILQ